VRFSECFLEGPEDGTLGMLGEPDSRVRLGSCRRGVLLAILVERRRENGRRFFGIVAQLLGELPPKGMEDLLGRSRLRRVASCREEWPRANANSGRFEVGPAWCSIGVAGAGTGTGTGTGREAGGSAESPLGRRSGRSVFRSGACGVLSARKRPSLALLDGCYRVVVELAGDTRGRRFLTASSKASQSTSGDWCGRQGEQSPRAVVT
jgi:hypothetical protein